MRLALEEAEESGLHLDMPGQVFADYEKSKSEGRGELGTQALIKYYEEEKWD